MLDSINAESQHFNCLDECCVKEFHSTMRTVVYCAFLVLSLYINPLYALVPQKILGPKQPLNDTIASFNKIIESGRLSSDGLAQRYWERGIQYGKLARYDHAIKDYSSAIHLNPAYVNAYIERAKAYARLENYRAAYDDLNRSLEIEPENAAAYVTRGTLSFLLGNYQQAAADYERYLNIYPKDIYRMLWLFLSEKHHNRKNISNIHKYADNVDLEQWPGAFVKLYMNEVEVETLINALSKGVPNMQAGHKCEAYFYLAQFYLLHNNNAKAKELFNKAVATNAKSYLEYEFAVAYSLKLNK